ncbi:IDEAL domain-containing protein [Halalkalibacter alkaliphilus]|uniref:IDEAL domain-containing protein n=1 Tax=Halalkalibacter alkaliphilus TaxID=2917993 RepID=A0A9X2CU75_9BACI|nr:IDEAL domain-containing protein [Halalkalibacter alkaliphilus]MCL7748157.1 IDEAL domain-containing protein [Halalkalibacter alkaliphilus]
MINDFAMDPRVTKQLRVIKSLQSRSEDTVQSLYAQAVIEYSLYHFKKEHLKGLIDKALSQKDEKQFHQLTTEYNQWIQSHSEGKTVKDNGFELHLTFE